MAPISALRFLYLVNEIRKRPDMSDAELAKFLGVSARTVNRYRKLIKSLPTELPWGK